MKQLYSGRATVMINDQKPIEGQLYLYDNHLLLKTDTQSEQKNYDIAAITVSRTEVTARSLIIRRNKPAIKLIFEDGSTYVISLVNVPSIQLEALYQLILKSIREAKEVRKDEIRKQRNAAELETKYKHACLLLNSAINADQANEVYQIFISLGSYRDAETKAYECLAKAKQFDLIAEENRRKIEEARRKAEEEACRKAEEEARRKAEEEARRKAEEEACRKAEEEARRKAEEEARRKAEEEAHRKAEEEARRKAEEEARRKAEEEEHRKAEEEVRRKAEEEARRKAEEEEQITSRLLLKAGDKVLFGSFPFSSKEDIRPIEWNVLKVLNGKALLISAYVLERIPYNDYLEYLTWADCSLRSWLNNHFYDVAFSSDEKLKIVLTDVDNSQASCNTLWNTIGGKNTNDRVFILSHAEAETLLNDQSSRMARPTDYAISHGVKTETTGDAWWWLRSPGRTQRRAERVLGDGRIGRCNRVQSADEGVRPVIWVTLPLETIPSTTPAMPSDVNQANNGNVDDQLTILNSEVTVSNIASSTPEAVQDGSDSEKNNFDQTDYEKEISESSEQNENEVRIPYSNFMEIRAVAAEIGVHENTIKSWLKQQREKVNAKGILSNEQYQAIIAYFGKIEAADKSKLDVDPSHLLEEILINNDDVNDETTTPADNSEYKPTVREEIGQVCKTLAADSIKKIATPRTINVISKSRNTVLLDIINSQYINCDADSAQFMPVYAINSDGTKYPVHPHGLYNNDIVSSYELFYRSTRSDLRLHILSDSIRETASYASEKVCLMPDAVDDFNKGFRKQCAGIFQIPRSIAAVYAQSIKYSSQQLPEAVVCLDYDGEDLTAIEIDRITVNDEEILLRKGRKKISGRHPNYRSLAQEYLSRYLKKNGIALSNDTREMLINTKLLLKIIHSPKEKFMFADNGRVVCMQADLDIANTVAQIILQDAEQLKKELNCSVLMLCNFSENSSFVGIKDLKIGCAEILARKQQELILWREYLPKLKLEVIQDGTFAQIQLISEKDQTQDIRRGKGYALDEEIEIKVEHGVISLPANPDNLCYNLPLERETYGTDEPDKMAQFVLKEALEEDRKVELRVFYRYGDESSYKLKAIIPETGEEIESEWCDSEPLSNPIPTYEYIDQKTSSADMAVLSDLFSRFSSEMHMSHRPPRLRNNTTYKENPENKEFLSYYLEARDNRHRLLLRWPFKNIYDCFKRENSYDAINELQYLMDKSYLSCIADVLNDRLPIGHDLDKKPVGSSESEKVILKRHLGDLIRQFGVMYSLTDDDIAGISPIIQDYLNYFKAEKRRHIENWAAISTYVDLDNDPYRIWPTLQKELKALNPNAYQVVDELRGISGVCYQTKDWIFALYDSPEGPQNVRRIIKAIKTYLDGKEWDKPGKKYNAKKLRDVLELLLAICLLRERDPMLLDCNSKDTKDLVKQLKALNEIMRIKQTAGLLKGSLKPRIHQRESVPHALYNVNPIIYALIQTLSGGKSVNLVGFTDD